MAGAIGDGAANPRAFGFVSGLAGAAGTMDHAGQLVPIVDGDGQDVVIAADGGVDRFRREPGEEGEAHRQEMGEGDAVEKVEGDRPEKSNFVSRALRGCG